MDIADKAKREFQTFRYFSKVAGSKFYFADGHEIQFVHGFYDLKEEELQDPFFSNNEKHTDNGKVRFEVYKRELDGLIKTGNPLLYIQGTQPEPLPKPRDSKGRVGVDTNALSEGELATQDAALSGVPNRIAGERNAGPSRSDPNASTIDTQLQNIVLREKPKSRIEQLKEAAANAAGSANGGVSSNS